MTTLDTQVTEAMAALADQAPTDAGLLARVQVRTQRRERARRVQWGVASVGLAAVAAAAAVALPGAGSAGLEYGATSPDAFFESGADLAVRFPFTLGTLPRGVDANDISVYRDDELLTATWTYPPPNDSVALELLVGQRPLPTDGDPISRSETVTVRGHAGELTCSDLTCALRWREAAGQWLRLSGAGMTDDDVASLKAVAEGLQRLEYVRRPTGVLAGVVPRGCGLRGAGDSFLQLTGGPTCNRVSAQTYTGTSRTDRPGGRSVVIDGRPGLLSTYGEPGSLLAPLSYRVTLDLGDGRALEVMVPQGTGWDEPLLRYFIEHLTVKG